MRKLLLLLSFLFPAIIFAQKDSIHHYERAYEKAHKAAYDSLLESEPLASLRGNIVRLKTTTNSYRAFVLFGELLRTDVSGFNRVIMQEGFSEMPQYSFRIGIGTSNKWRQFLLDSYWGVSGFNHRATKGDEKILTSLSNVFQFDAGYEVLSTRSISIYPFAGLSARLANLTYQKEGQANPNYTSITNFVLNSQNINSTSIRLGYQIGLGFDVTVAQMDDKATSLIIFTKGGVNRPIGTDKYKINGAHYQPNIRHGVWGVSLGVKFASRM